MPRLRAALEDRLVFGLFLAVVMALQFGVDVAASEDVEQALVGMAGEADQPAREFRELFQGGGAFALLGSQLHAGDQAAEVAVAFARFHQQRIGEPVGAGDLRADVRADSGFLRSHVEARRAVHAVAVDERHGGHAETGAGSREFFGHGRTFEKAEAGAGV